MKRTFAIFAVAMAMACAAAGRASAQAPADDLMVDAAREQYGKAEQRAIDAAIEFRKQPSKIDSDAQGDNRRAFREKLRQLVEESFDARQRLRLAELKELRRRLGEIELAVEQREKHKHAIVDLHVEELMNMRPSSFPGAPAEARTFSPQPLSNQVLEDSALEARTSPPTAPPGTEAHVRYVQEQVEINGEVKTVTRPVIEYRTIPGVSVPQDRQDRPSLADSSSQPPSATNNNLNIETRHSVEGVFDFHTREQLAQLELEEAEFELVAAGRELQVAKSDNARLEGVRKKKKAEYELKRARLKLEGLARQRAELQTAAEVEVAEAEAEVRRVEAKADVAKADVIAAEAQLEKQQAEVEGAAARFAHERKVLERLRELATVQKAVDMKLVDEKELNKKNAEGALESVKSGLETAKAKLVQAQAGVKEVVAELSVAQARLRAAQARRERLKQDDSPNAVEAGSSDSVPAKSENKERR